MSLLLSYNLQIDRKIHLQLCKADESAAKEKSFMNLAINQSEYELLTVWGIECNSWNWLRHPSWKFTPISIDQHVCMYMLSSTSVGHLFLNLCPSLDCVPAKSTLFMTQ